MQSIAGFGGSQLRQYHHQQEIISEREWAAEQARQEANKAAQEGRTRQIAGIFQGYGYSREESQAIQKAYEDAGLEQLVDHFSQKSDTPADGIATVLAGNDKRGPGWWNNKAKAQEMLNAGMSKVDVLRAMAIEQGMNPENLGSAPNLGRISGKDAAYQAQVQAAQQQAAMEAALQDILGSFSSWFAPSQGSGQNLYIRDRVISEGLGSISPKAADFARGLYSSWEGVQNFDRKYSGKMYDVEKSTKEGLLKGIEPVRRRVHEFLIPAKEGVQHWSKDGGQFDMAHQSSDSCYWDINEQAVRVDWRGEIYSPGNAVRMVELFDQLAQVERQAMDTASLNESRPFISTANLTDMQYNRGLAPVFREQADRNPEAVALSNALIQNTLFMAAGPWATESLVTKLPKAWTSGTTALSRVGRYLTTTERGRAITQTAIDVNVTGLVNVPMEAFRALRQGESYGLGDIPGSYMRGMGLGLVPSGIANSGLKTPLQMGFAGLYYGGVDYLSGVPEHGLMGNWQDRGTSALLTGLGGAYLHGFG